MWCTALLFARGNGEEVEREVEDLCGKKEVTAKAITFLSQGSASTLHRETKRGQRGTKMHMRSNARNVLLVQPVLPCLVLEYISREICLELLLRLKSGIIAAANVKFT